jgi:hypothetical protein
LVLIVQRVARFEQQPRCGRVAFALAQPATKRVWPAAGGELNLCEDGRPPLKMCPGQPAVLVPARGHCAGGAAPVDTPELAQAISAALNAGGLSIEQLRDQLQQQGPGASAQTAPDRGVTDATGGRH